MTIHLDHTIVPSHTRDASAKQADANRTRGVPKGETPEWEEPSRAVREYLDGLEKSNPVAEDDDDAPTPPGRNVSLTDPAAHWTAAPGGPPQYAYSTNYLIDLDAGIILDVEATPAHRTDEVASTRTMIERVEKRFDLKPKRLVGDTAYGAAPMLNWIVNDKQIEPHIPVWEKAERDDKHRDNALDDVMAAEVSEFMRQHAGDFIVIGAKVLFLNDESAFQKVFLFLQVLVLELSFPQSKNILLISV